MMSALLRAGLALTGCLLLEVNVLGKKGYAVISVMAVAAVLILMSGAVSVAILYRIQIYTAHINKIKAGYLADSGIRYTLKFLSAYYNYNYTLQKTTKYDSTLSTFPFTISLTDQGDTIEVTRESNNGILIYKSKATLGNSSRTVECQIATESDDLIDSRISASTNGYIYDRDLPIIKWR
jgi:hypothetical protein